MSNTPTTQDHFEKRSEFGSAARSIRVSPDGQSNRNFAVYIGGLTGREATIHCVACDSDVCISLPFGMDELQVLHDHQLKHVLEERASRNR